MHFWLVQSSVCSRLIKKKLFLLPGSLKTHNCDTLSQVSHVLKAFDNQERPGWPVAVIPPLLGRKRELGVLGGPRLTPGTEQEPSIQPHPVFPV